MIQGLKSPPVTFSLENRGKMYLHTYILWYYICMDCICGQNKEERKLISGTLEAFKSIIFKKDVTPIIDVGGDTAYA